MASSIALAPPRTGGVVRMDLLAGTETVSPMEQNRCRVVKVSYRTKCRGGGGREGIHFHPTGMVVAWADHPCVFRFLMQSRVLGLVDRGRHRSDPKDPHVSGFF